jgi:hypothetical protein
MSSFAVKGMFKVLHLDKEGNLKNEFDVPNGITDVGLNHILDTEFDGGTPITTWYIGIIDNVSFTALAAADTMASHAGWIANEDYTEATHPEWTAGTAAARSITNAVTVDFSINATVTLKGIFITSQSAKATATGTLWSTAAFASNVAAVNGDTLKITYTVSG